MSIYFFTADIIDDIVDLWSFIKIVFVVGIIAGITYIIFKAVMNHHGKKTLNTDNANVDYVIMHRKKVRYKNRTFFVYDAFIYLKDGTKKEMYDVSTDSNVFQTLKSLAVNNIRLEKWADDFKVRRCPTCHRVLKYNEEFCKQCYVKATKPSNDNSISDYDRYLERKKMSASLRYDVLKRDGFKCKICGATADDGAKLHVDHIIPISKGGKTEMDNLQTLCERCNLGKSDKL